MSTPAPTRLVDFGFNLNRGFTTSPTLGTSYDALAIASALSVTGPTNGVFDLTKYHSGGVARWVHIFPFGDANNGTFSLRVKGWRQAGALYVPYTLFEADCVAGNFPGVAGSTDVSSSEFLADTITPVANMGNGNVDYVYLSPQDDTPGHVLVDLKGCQRLQFQLKKGTVTVANLLFAVL